MRSLPSHLHPVSLLVQKGSTFSRHEPRLAYDELVTATESLARLSELRAVCLRSEDEPTFIHSTNSYRVPTVCQGSFWARVTSVGKK